MMNLDYYKKSKEYVNSLFQQKYGDKPTSEFIHFERTVYWMKILDPLADEAALIAAYCHDVERSARENAEYRDNKLTKADRLRLHQEVGAQMMCGFLMSINAPAPLYEKVYSMIRMHEEGGDYWQNLLLDADSISFFETKVSSFISKVARKGYDEIHQKFTRMYERLHSDRAREIAKPFYDAALVSLAAARPK